NRTRNSKGGFLTPGTAAGVDRIERPRFWATVLQESGERTTPVPISVLGENRKASGVEIESPNNGSQLRGKRAIAHGFWIFFQNSRVSFVWRGEFSVWKINCIGDRNSDRIADRNPDTSDVRNREPALFGVRSTLCGLWPNL